MTIRCMFMTLLGLAWSWRYRSCLKQTQGLSGHGTLNLRGSSRYDIQRCILGSSLMDRRYQRALGGRLLGVLGRFERITRSKLFRGEGTLQALETAENKAHLYIEIAASKMASYRSYFRVCGIMAHTSRVLHLNTLSTELDCKSPGRQGVD